MSFRKRVVTSGHKRNVFARNKLRNDRTHFFRALLVARIAHFVSLFRAVLEHDHAVFIEQIEVENHSECEFSESACIRRINENHIEFFARNVRIAQNTRKIRIDNLKIAVDTLQIFTHEFDAILAVVNESDFLRTS